MLKLRKGWKLVFEEGVTYLYPPGEDTTSNLYYVDLYYVDYVDTSDDEKDISVYPNGGMNDFRVFDNMLDAHEYLIKKGRESPWEEV